MNKTCNKLENSLTITASLVALIIKATSLPNADKIKEATKIKTQKTPNNLATSQQRLKQT